MNVRGYTLNISCNRIPLNSQTGDIYVISGVTEVLPLVIKPGIIVKEYIKPFVNAPTTFGSWASAPTTTPFFTFVDATQPGYSGPAKIEGFSFLGGDTPFSFTATGSIEVLIQNCEFVGNGVAVDVSATASDDIKVGIVNCTVMDSYYSYTTHTPIQYTPCRVGFRFKSEGTTAAANPLITAEIVNLEVSGLFQSGFLNPTAPISLSTEGCDIVQYSSAGGGSGVFSRLVEVHTKGNVSRLEFTPTFSQNLIPAVDLKVSGGVFDGNAALNTDRGWDVGIYAIAEGLNNSGGTVNNYANRFSVEVTGTIIEDFRAAGIYAQVGEDTRGHVNIHGQAEIRRTGVQNASSSDDILYSAVHAVARLGYLSLLTNRALIRDNLGNGVLCFSPGTGLAPVPNGLYLGMKQTGVHGNGGSGIVLDAGAQHANYPQIKGAMVGGTRDLTSTGQMSLVKNGAKPTDGALPHQGQGYINGCAISANGGRYGVLVRARGNSMVGFNDVVEKFSAASCRIVNSYVWGFGLGGYYAELGRFDLLQTGPTLLVPVVHSTIVNNPAFSVDIKELNAGVAYRYYRDDPVGGEYLNTMFVHSIFDTRSASTDFGPNLDPFGAAEWTTDNGLGTGTGSHIENHDKPHVASIRALLTNGSFGMLSYTDKNPIYQGSPSGIFPDQWYMDQGSDITLRRVANFLNAGLDFTGEDLADIQNMPRNSMPTDLRDKGGEQD